MTNTDTVLLVVLCVLCAAFGFALASLYWLLVTGCSNFASCVPA